MGRRFEEREETVQNLASMLELHGEEQLPGIKNGHFRFVAVTLRDTAVPATLCPLATTSLSSSWIHSGGCPRSSSPLPFMPQASVLPHPSRGHLVQ